MFLLPGKRGEKHRLSDFNAVYYCIKIEMVCQPLFFKKGKKFFRPFPAARVAYIIMKETRDSFFCTFLKSGSVLSKNMV